MRILVLTSKSSTLESNSYLLVAKEAALKGGKYIKDGFFNNKELIIKEKKKNDFVTNLDIESEKIIREVIKKFNSKAKIIGEEEEAEGQDSESIVWFIDPLDGTGAFIRGNIAFVSISVAAVDNKTKEIIAGVIYNPFTEMLYTSTETDAFLNDTLKLQTNDNISLKKARVLIDISENLPSYFRKILSSADVDKIGRILRYDGSFAQHCCLIAKGTLDAGIFWGVGDKGNFYDIASALLICRNAGLLVTDLYGKNLNFSSASYDQLIVAPPKLHSEIIKFVEEISFLSTKNLSDLESEILLYLRDEERSVQMRHLKNKFSKVPITNLQISLQDLKEKRLIVISKSWIKFNFS